MRPLTFALPKGRLLDPTLARLAGLGISIPEGPARQLCFSSVDGSIEFLLAKPADVPTYVALGAADLGAVGTDVLMEGDWDVLRPLALGFGRCRIVVAARTDDSAATETQPRRVATKYPRIAERYFAEQRLQVDLITLRGSVELAPLVGLSDWIVDLVETGATLKANGLVPIAEVASTEAQLIVNRATHKIRRREVQDLIAALEAVATC